MNKKVSLVGIGYCCDIGGRHPGPAKAPSTLQHSKWMPQLHWETMLPVVSNAKKLSAIADIVTANKQLAQRTCQLANNQQSFIVFGGDQTGSLGTWSGVSHALRKKGNLGLIWFDAHMDSHTPNTSETGNIHGMPLAALLGYGDKRMTKLLNNQAKLKPENICLIGVRSYEQDEAELLKKLKVRVFFIDEVKKRGLPNIMQEALSIVKENTVNYGVTVDIDVIDPAKAPGVSVPEPNGVCTNELLQCLHAIKNDKEFIALEIVEFNPSLDQEQKTEKIVADIVKAVYY